MGSKHIQPFWHFLCEAKGLKINNNSSTGKERLRWMIISSFGEFLKPGDKPFAPTGSSDLQHCYGNTIDLWSHPVSLTELLDRVFILLVKPKKLAKAVRCTVGERVTSVDVDVWLWWTGGRKGYCWDFQITKSNWRIYILFCCCCLSKWQRSVKSTIWATVCSVNQTGLIARGGEEKINSR